MKLRLIVSLLAALTAAATSAQSVPSSSLYNGQEVSLDLFGTYLNPEQKFTDLFDTNIHRGVWGGGVGLSYYITSVVGVGADFNVSDYDGGDWKIDYALGDVYLRWPLGNSGLAPYLCGTGGRGFTPAWQWIYGGGVGLEFRFTRAIGIFSDARFLWSDSSTSLNTPEPPRRPALDILRGCLVPGSGARESCVWLRNSKLR